MGPLRYLPMPCKHKIVSLHHNLTGFINIKGKEINFNNGIGYIEGDFGTSFPSNYAWLQCNDFSRKACIFVSVADISVARLQLRGSIGIIYFGGKEYRLATYLGARIIMCSRNKLILKQGKLVLEIQVDSITSRKLIAPREGKMTRKIEESISCQAHFRFSMAGKVLFDETSRNASYEFVTNK